VSANIRPGARSGGAALAAPRSGAIAGEDVVPLGARDAAAAARTRVPLAWAREHAATIARWVVIAAVVGLWQASATFLNPIFISSPVTVVRDFASLVGNGQLPSAFGSSIGELAAGAVIALVLGVTIGMSMGRIRLIERALDPLVALGNATPSIALLPVMVVWFGVGSSARIAFIMVLGLWTFIINTLAGVRSVRGGLRDVGVAFGLGPWRQTWEIYLPATAPYIFVAARIAMAQATVGMILSGQEVGQGGLGGLAADFGSYSETGQLIATIATTTALAMFLFWLIRTVQARAFPWINETSAGRR